ncbi:hypothetical protein KRX51_01135 [Corynebacterium sp. TAE3-ERU12]|uniref:hypothetical protein n=1 Tax=Corynebacterium sp. TAE3-ERU12 TaxID=2849491 RepID=UPI001C489636|nr:hypothetical protein [Corynebacterium sp. TAE3-ERU12]MBV7294522.1 hypothetical protein [Corynebacterium sp. TAE3-ERU12]
MTDHNDDNTTNSSNNERGLRDAVEFLKTPVYAWLGAGVRTVEMLGEIGERVRNEETVKDAQQRATESSEAAAERAREAYTKLITAAQQAFNENVERTQRAGDATFAKASELPDDLEARLSQLRPEQVRELTESYLEQATRIYRELAEVGEETVHSNLQTVKLPTGRLRRNPNGRPNDPDNPLYTVESEPTDGGQEGSRRRGPLGLADVLGIRVPRSGRTSAASMLSNTVDELAQEAARPLVEAGEELRRRITDEGVTDRLQGALKDAADVTESLLGALRQQTAAARDGEVIDLDPDDVENVSAAATRAAAAADAAAAAADEAARAAAAADAAVAAEAVDEEATLAAEEAVAAEEAARAADAAEVDADVAADEAEAQDQRNDLTSDEDNQ